MPGWVTTRAQCTARKMFSRLITQVNADVDEANAALTPSGAAGECFRVVSRDGCIEVFDDRRAGQDESGVRLALERDEIHISGCGHGQPVVVTTGFSSDGRNCVFRAKDKELSDGEMSRLVLERLFFPEG